MSTRIEACVDIKTKLVIMDKKKDVSLAKVEASREEAMNKAKLEEMRIDVRPKK